MNSTNPYIETNYYVDILKQPIKINEHHQELDKLLNKHESKTWAYITAYNPFSKKLSEDENIMRNKKLESLLIGNKIFYSGRGESINGDWPPEESFLILEISRRDAIKFAKKFKQNAIVFGCIQDVPELITINHRFRLIIFITMIGIMIKGALGCRSKTKK